MLFSMQRVRDGIDCLLDLLYPPYCQGCGADADGRGLRLCEDCRASIPLVDCCACEKCAAPVGKHAPTEGCSNCGGSRLHFDRAAAACRYEGLARDLILRFKYGRHTAVGGTLARLMADAARRRGIAEDADLVAPVPLHEAKLKERGFNQASILAERVSRRLGCVCVPDLLVRVAQTRAQTELDREARVANVKGAFAVRNGTDVTGARVLLIDDVMTTGSTLSECAAALRRAGAVGVNVLVAARD